VKIYPNYELNNLGHLQFLQKFFDSDVKAFFQNLIMGQRPSRTKYIGRHLMISQYGERQQNSRDIGYEN